MCEQRPQPRTSNHADQSLKDLEDTLLRSLRLLPLVDVGNISLPSPRGPPPLQAGDDISNSDNVDYYDFTQAHGGADNALARPHCSRTPLPPVLQKVRQCIVQGEYNEFNDLLCEALFPARYGTSPSPTLSFRVSHVDSAEGEMVILQRRPATHWTICDMSSWMEAWNVYIAVLVALRKHGNLWLECFL